MRVAWFSYFPVEWMDEMPVAVRRLARGHPATWQQALLGEMEKDPRVELHIIVLRKHFPSDLRFERRGVFFHLLKTKGLVRVASLFYYDTALIRRELARIQPDLVHAWGTEDAAGLVATRLPYPALISVQGLFTYFRQHITLTWRQQLIQRLEVLALRKARTLSAESACTAAQVRQLSPQAQVLHIEHPPLAMFHAVERKPQTDPPVLLSVGSWDLRKGNDLMLQAADALRHRFRFKLVCITPPSALERREITRHVSPEFLQQVEFKCRLSMEQMLAEYGRATLLLMPSRADTGPVAVKEAVVAGLPVVASRVGGVPEYVEPGLNGLICEVNDLDSLKAGLVAALQHPLLGRGLVDPKVLAEKRALLSAKRAADQFVETYKQLSLRKV